LPRERKRGRPTAQPKNTPPTENISTNSKQSLQATKLILIEMWIKIPPQLQGGHDGLSMGLKGLRARLSVRARTKLRGLTRHK
jgi:hypothetical protein